MKEMHNQQTLTGFCKKGDNEPYTPSPKVDIQPFPANKSSPQQLIKHTIGNSNRDAYAPKSYMGVGKEARKTYELPRPVNTDMDTLPAQVLKQQ